MYPDSMLDALTESYFFTHPEVASRYAKGSPFCNYMYAWHVQGKNGETFAELAKDEKGANASEFAECATWGKTNKNALFMKGDNRIGVDDYFPQNKKHKSKIFRVLMTPTMTDMTRSEARGCELDTGLPGVKGNGKTGGYPSPQKSWLYGVSVLSFDPADLGFRYSHPDGARAYASAMASGGRPEAIIFQEPIEFEHPPTHKNGWFKLGGGGVWGEASKDEKEGGGVQEWEEELEEMRRMASEQGGGHEEVPLLKIFKGDPRDVVFGFTGENPSTGKRGDMEAMELLGASARKAHTVGFIDVMVIKNSSKLGSAEAVKARKAGKPFLVMEHFKRLVREKTVTAKDMKVWYGGGAFDLGKEDDDDDDL